MDKFSVLQQYFGHSSFRPGQEQVVDAIVSRRMSSAFMPPGTGKSVCYQVPAMLIRGLRCHFTADFPDAGSGCRPGREGVHAACLNSALPEGLYSTILRAALEGDYKILYVAPERLLTDSFLYLAMRARIAFCGCGRSPLRVPMGSGFPPQLPENCRIHLPSAVPPGHWCVHGNGNGTGQAGYHCPAAAQPAFYADHRL